MFWLLQRILSRNLFLVAILARNGGGPNKPYLGPPESIPKRPQQQQHQQQHQQQQQQKQQEQEQEQSQVTESKR